ncbi:hypothetical protein CBS9595_001135 [Malassezia furfur]|nr:hypothetical protein CBS9595_001135 [Malassezia furfur]
MIDSLAHHGILASDLARSLITTHTIANPGYDPTLDDSTDEPPKPVLPTPSTESGPPAEPAVTAAAADDSAAAATVLPSSPPLAPAPVHGDVKTPVRTDPNTAAQIAERDAAATESTASAPVVDAQALHRPEPSVPPSQNTLEGVTTEISASSKTITLDIRWTVLCDLFLVLTADSVYDARSRVLLERVAQALQLTWMDLTKFEKRVTDALEIEEDVQTLNDARISERRRASAQKKRMMMMGLATVGGGLVIGLSAGLLAPVIGAGIGAALGAVGISGTSAFLGGGVGAAAITTTGTLGGAALGGRGMSRRTRSVKTFEFRPMHNHKRVNCIVTVPGFLRGPEDDPTLPFGVIDPVMGDAFSVMWDPEMMREMGNAMSILWNETIVQGVQQVLAATVAGAMFSALAWPLWLTKLSYIIDNPWSNATERARAAGLILADVLMNRQLGVRPITLVGFSLGARMIYYALRELAHKKAYGIVQNVYLLGAPVTAREAEWKQVRSVVSGRFVNGTCHADPAFSRSDWLLAYLHRATSGGFHSIAGLHPIEYDCNIENVDVTHLVPGHLSYRVLTPLVLGELGFKTTADYFDEPESLDQVPEREVVFDAGLDTPSTPKSKLSFKNIFSRKTPREDRTERTAAALSAAVRTTAADAGARDEYVVDDDAPETEDDQKSAGVTGPPAATEQASEPMPGSKEGATEVSVDTKEPTQTVGSDATAGAVEQAEAPAQHSVDNLAASASATDLDAPSQVPVPTEREEASSARPGQEEVPVSKKPASPSAALDSPARAASAAAASAEALTEPHQNVRAEPTAARDAEPATMSHDATERSEAPSPSPPTVPVSPPDTDEPTDAPPAPAPPAAAFASVAATAGNYGLSSEEAERLASQFQGTTLSAAPTFSADDAWDSPSLAIPLSDSADASNDPRRAADRARLPEWAAENPWG